MLRELSQSSNKKQGIPTKRRLKKEKKNKKRNVL